MSTCLCALARPTSHRTEVLVLQHPQEQRQAKNSVTLLRLSLAHCEVIVGERFAQETLQALLHRPGRQTRLLYPDVAAAPAPSPPPPPTTAPGELRLVVLDATWRKSRKMLHQSPALQRLPRLALDEVPDSRYAIRKAHAPGQLSTLEATCAALAQLEGNTARWQPLLEAFDGFVAQQRVFMPN